MSAVAILNIVLVVVVSVGIVSFLGWSIIADEARAATRVARDRSPARAGTARAARPRRSPARGFTA